MTLQDFRCHQRVVVRRAEVDAQGIVYNAHYATYADVALVHYWQQLGLPDSAWQQLGGSLQVQRLAITYGASGRTGDALDVGLRCKAHDGRLQCEAGIFRGAQWLNTVSLTLAWQDRDGNPQLVPAALCHIVQRYEAGEPVLQLQSGSWNDLGRWAERLRVAVFVHEQGVPRELEMDVHDPLARHVVVSNGLGQPVATGRLVSHAPGVGRIGRMAVDRSLRGTGVGRQVLDALVDAARTRGDHAVVLHAQCHAQGFYARAGFEPEGEVYDEAGIDHITMRRSL